MTRKALAIGAATLATAVLLAAWVAWTLVLSVVALPLALLFGARKRTRRRIYRAYREFPWPWEPPVTTVYWWALGEQLEVVAPERERLRMSTNERAEVVAYLRRLYGDNCRRCGRPIDFWVDQNAPWEFAQWAEEVDHIIPFSRGGACDVSNFQLLHARCNRSKGARYYGPAAA